MAGRRSLLALPRDTMRWVRQRLRERPDTEHEIALNRFAIGTFLLAFFLIKAHYNPERGHELLRDSIIFFAVFYPSTIALFIHLLVVRGPSPVRRVISAAHDIVMISSVAVVGGSTTGFFYPVFLWAIFGNGFRFGLPYLYITMGISVTCFSGVLYLTGFWWSNTGLSIALAVTLIVLPLYASLLIRKLQEAKRQAEEASKAKSLFLASVSHELRTPLNAIIGLSDLLDDRNRDPKEADMIGAIGKSGRLLLEMIDELLNFSRLEARRMPSRIAEVDLYELVGRVRSVLQVQADKKGIELGAIISASTPRKVMADGRHIEEILINLLSNAIKFTAEGSVRLTLQALRMEDDRADLRFEVNDSGIGVAEAAQERIFESFTQADETIIDQFGGTGLGLSICKQLVEMMGGQIGICSTLGKGSTFWFELSLERVTEEAQAVPGDLDVLMIGRSDELIDLMEEVLPQARLATEIEGARRELAASGARTIVLVEASLREGLELRLPNIAAIDVATADTEAQALRNLPAPFVGQLSLPGTPQLLRRAIEVAQCALTGGGEAHRPSLSEIAPRSLRVLVAEDNQTNQMVIEKILERAGHSVTLAENGEVAVDLLRQGAFDVVLMDVNMPVMNGIEATKLYRFASLGQQRIPIIALTADATQQARVRCAEAGMDACATKPIEARELLKLISEMTADVPVADPEAKEVVGIDSHPAFGPKDGRPLRIATLHDLESLGGQEFVEALVEQFLTDAERLLSDLAVAVEQRDAAQFAEVAHALRSAAANVGAESIFAHCLAWRRTDPDELAEKGVGRLAILRQELTLASTLLRAHVHRTQAEKVAR